MANPRLDLVLREKRELAPNTLELCYECEDGGAIPFVPGQFFSLHFESPQGEKTRSYSASNGVESIRDNRRFCFAISEVPGGLASTHFFSSTPGDRVAMSGPYGALILPPQDPVRYILVGTGTGVAPYRSMLPQLEKRLLENPGLEIVLVMGVRRPQELIYRDEFEAFAASHERFSFIACYSRELPSQLQGHENDGRVQTVLPALDLKPGDDMVYLCGNPNMVDETATMLFELGFEKRMVKREKYNFSTL